MHSCALRVIFVLLLLGAFPGRAAAQSTGAIAGTVTDAATGAPLSNVMLRFLTESGAYAGVTYSDASGAYALGGLAAGTYLVRTYNAFPYLDEVYDDLPCPGGGCSPLLGTGVTVAAGATASGIDFGLALGGTIAGTVTDAATGTPLANIKVQIRLNGGYSGGGQNFTDASGAYSVLGLPTGTYNVLTANSFPYLDVLYNDIPCPDGYCEVTSGTGVAVTAGATTANINIALTHGGTITGIITDAASGTPLEGVRVDVYNQYGGGQAAGPTDASGVYSITGLTTGTYYVRTTSTYPYLSELYDNLPCPNDSCQVTAGTGVNVTAGETTSGIGFALSGGGTITGTVTDATTGTPLSNIYVAVYNVNGVATAGIGTDLSGVFTISGLTTGIYFVRTVISFPYLDELYNNIPCPNGACSVTSGTAVNVTSGATTSGINFGLMRGGAITGTVTAAATGVPRPDVRVDAYTLGGELASQAWSNGSGVYAIEGLLTGTYYVRAWNSYPYLGELYNDVPCPGGNCALNAGTGVSVTTAATTSGINIGLTLGGTIAGTVTNATTGAPIANAQVSVYTATRESAGGGWTDAAGTYSVNGLAPGTYYVRTGGDSTYRHELYDNISCHPDCDVTQGAGVTVTPGATTANINFALDRWGVIAGTVRNSMGAPIASVVVMTFNATGAAGGQSVTDASGSYSIPFLEPGTYYVRTQDALPYLGVLYDGKPCSPSCLVTSGTPVNVSLNNTTSGIDFDLSIAGSIAGTVRQGVAGPPLPDVQVTVFSPSGAWAGSSTTDASGVYAVSGLAPGTWYVRASRGMPFLDQMYDGRSCMGADCVPANGIGVTVTEGSVTAGIDFGLRTAAHSDFDGNLKSDVLWRHATLGEVWLWPMDGATRLSESFVRTVADTNWEIRALGDLDASTTADLLWRNKVTGEIYVWPMNGATPSWEIYVATVDPAYDVAGMGDFNGDGKADVLWRHSTTGDVWVWLMDSYTPTSKAFVARVDPGYVIKGVGDLNGDNKADIVWHHASTGEVWVWPMDGTTRLSETWVATVPDTGYQIQGVADFTGDGKADLVWHHATLSEVWIWTMNGPVRVAETWLATVPDTAYRIVGTGDYNGDGLADLLWHHATRGEVWVWLMDGPVRVSETWVATVADTGYRIIK